MNLPQNLPTAVPFFGKHGAGADADQWYIDSRKQTFRHSYCNVEPEAIAIQSRYDRLLPFVIKKDTSSSLIAVLLVEKNATGFDTVNINGHADITALVTVNTITHDGQDYFEFAGGVDINQATAFDANSVDDPTPITTNWADWVQPNGLYYLIILLANGTRFYSELLQVVDFPEFSEIPDDRCLSRVRIECTNTCEIGGIPPVVFASQKLFIDYPTSKPTYPFKEERGEDGNGNEKLYWRNTKKRWTVSFYAIETIADFCSLLPSYAAIPTGVNITDTYGVQSAVTDVEVEISWPEETLACLALISISFTRDFVAFNACC